MGTVEFKVVRGIVLLVWVLLGSVAGPAAGNVVLIGKNVSLSFEDIEANFAPSIKASGIRGVLYVAEPLDACSPLKNEIDEGSDPPAFALILRGSCAFDDKVRSAQRAGFRAAIVYNNEEHGPLVAMAGNPAGIHINAVFVSKSSGEILQKYAGRTDVELWIIPTFENSAWSIMAISFISLLAMSAVLATCFFVRRQRIRRDPRASNIREFHGMSKRLVRAMPSLIFTSVLEDNTTSATCAICLEDYRVGEKLRILPCCHKFHALCVDSWLTSWRTFCPVCKRDARTSTGDPPPSENTPLLSSAASTPTSSFYSSVATSSAIHIPQGIQINQTPPISSFTNRTPSLAGSTSRVPRPISRSPAISISRSSVDLRNASPHNRLHASSSLGFPQSSPLNSRFMSSYVPSPNNGSSSYLAGSSSRHPYLHHCTESGASLSAMDSTYSLPEAREA